jgi:ABC-type dipeptide/oligopeptide/nickel transport system ATPase component
MRERQREEKMALLITHDLGVVNQIAINYVMYCGRVEKQGREQVLKTPNTPIH